MSCFYEFERDLVRDRTIKALETKRKRGLNGGGPKTRHAKLTKALQDYHKGDMTVKEILKTYHIGRSTLYKYINLKHQQDSKT